MSIDPNNLIMGGGSRSAKFDAPGVTVGGVIEDISAKQQTDFTTGEPLTWPNGDPKMQVLVRVQTDAQESDDDDGVRTIFVKGKSLTNAVRDAVRGAGAKGLEVGGTLTVTYTGDGVSEKRGINPPKLYAAQYTKPNQAAAANTALGLNQGTATPAAAPDLSALDPKSAELITAMLAKQQSAPPF